MSMNKQKASEILNNYIRPNGGLRPNKRYISWQPGEITVTLDDYFTADELEAIAWWMHNNEQNQ